VSNAYEFLNANMPFVLHPRTKTQLSHTLAEAAVKLERYEQAFPILMDYCQEFPDDPDGQFLLGVCAYMLDKLDVAANAFQRYLELRPNADNQSLVRTILQEIDTRTSFNPITEPLYKGDFVFSLQ
jgi:tetratricopeptide (TPR) repeat protein